MCLLVRPRRQSDRIAGRFRPLHDWFVQAVSAFAHQHLVPVVQFANQPNLQGRYWSEFEKHCGLLDRVGYQILQRLEIATLQAFKQRAVKGIPLIWPESTSWM